MSNTLLKDAWTAPRLITNFPQEHEYLYQSAIQMHGDADLFIGKSKKPFRAFLTDREYYYSLQAKGDPKDLGEFWKLFEKLKNFAGVR